MNKKYIITGGPSTGKTSVINELIKNGFNCVHENSREIISMEIENGGEILPWKNQIAFENKVSNLRTKQYLTSPKNAICFFDRSVIDCLAYLKLNNLQATTTIINNLQKCNFNSTVFYTPIWKDIYINDNERKETLKEAKEIENSILRTYKSKGYKLIRIPRTPIKERVDFIISKI